jgi:hypothetical protein
MWRALSGGRHKGVQTAMGPSQSSSRSLETAHPVGCASALGRRFRDPKQIGWAAGDLPSRGGKLRASIPTWPLPPGPYDPHSVTPEVPQDPLTPSGWHALRAGVWHPRHRFLSSCGSACGACYCGGALAQGGASLLLVAAVTAACTKLPQPRVHLCQPTM